MSERLPKHLHDALTAARKAVQFLGDRDLEAYAADAMVSSAVERQVEVVGEACRRALDDVPALRERIPEAALAIAIRNRIAHGYDTVDHRIVMNTVRQGFPALIAKLVRELQPFGGSSPPT